MTFKKNVKPEKFISHKVTKTQNKKKATVHRGSNTRLKIGTKDL